MLQRKRKTRNPCAVCFLHEDRCICHLIPKLTLQTKLTLVIHHRELRRTTNTGRLALRTLTNSQMLVRGLKDSPLELSNLLSDCYESYLLDPSEDAADIVTLKPQMRVQLIVSDGNWRQASKLYKRHPELQGIQRVKITQKNRSEQHLRAEHFANGYSTLEAIAIAFGFFEGPHVQGQLLALYQSKLQATLQGRGGKI